MARKARDPEVQQLRESLKSFGFTIVTRLNRIFVVWAGAEQIYICKKLPRSGFWELNVVDRNLWEIHGALGIHVFQYISIQEIIKWFYDLALQTPAIVEGLRLEVADAGALKANAQRIYDREKPRDLEKEYAKARRKRRNKIIRERERSEQARQDAIRDRNHPASRNKRRGDNSTAKR